MAAASPNLRIALRFLTSRKRAMAMSLTCITLGVGLFVITRATTSGFEGLFIRTMLGTNGAIRIEEKTQDVVGVMQADTGGPQSSNFKISNLEDRKFIHGVEEPELLMAAVRNFQNVTGVAAVLTGSRRVRNSFNEENGQVFGVELDDFLQVSDLGSQIVAGSLQNFRETPMGLLVGQVMANRLKLSPGDTVLIDADEGAVRFRVSAIYETGVNEIDRQRVYLHLAEARSLLRRPTGASLLQINLRDRDRAPADAFFMSRTLGYSAISWQQRERSWLEVFRALKLSTLLTVMLFSLIAGIAMFNTLAMIAMEKTREIAILRSMGYTRRDIAAIFLWQASLVLAVGSVLGCLLGVGGTWAIATLPVRIRGIFATDTFIVAWSGWHYVEAVVMAAVMVMFASLLPARRAARLEPGDVIRGSAQ